MDKISKADVLIFINQMIVKYDLSSYETADRCMVWFANCLQDKPISCINDHEKYGTYSFVTEHGGEYFMEIYEIFKSECEKIDKLLTDKKQYA